MEKQDYVKHQLDHAEALNPEIDPIRNLVELVHWVDAAATEEVTNTVPTGFAYIITEVEIDNIGDASIVGLYDAAATTDFDTDAEKEATWKLTIQAKANDTTVVTGIRFKLTAGLGVYASVCLAAHNIKIKCAGYRIKV